MTTAASGEAVWAAGYIAIPELRQKERSRITRARYDGATSTAVRPQYRTSRSCGRNSWVPVGLTGDFCCHPRVSKRGPYHQRYCVGMESSSWVVYTPTPVTIEPLPCYTPSCSFQPVSASDGGGRGEPVETGHGEVKNRNNSSSRRRPA